jgi:methylated-DNA-[protein]-cysteine S-methyltransferase
MKSKEFPYEDLWQLLLSIPKGKVSTYKAVAKKLKLKNPRHAGYMLKQNEDAPEIPCHRIIQSSGMIGGYSGEIKGTKISRKLKLLKSEGVEFTTRGKIADSSRMLLKL